MVAVRLIQNGRSRLARVETLAELAGCEVLEGEAESPLIQLAREGEIYAITLQAYRKLRDAHYFRGGDLGNERVADLLSSVSSMHHKKWGLDFGLIEQIKKLDILKVAKDLGVELKQPKNSSKYRGFCPIHKQVPPSHPSFHVLPEKNLFKCYSCGEEGDAGRLVIRLLEDEYAAASYLCNQLGIPFCERGEAPESEVLERSHLFIDNVASYWEGRYWE